MPRIAAALRLSLNEARERIRAEAEPTEPVEVSLADGLGLVLAEAVVADVDHPPLDQATRAGWAVRAREATPGTLLRVARVGGSTHPLLESGEVTRVQAGDPLPPGADAVIRPRHVRPDDPETAPTRVVEVTRAVSPEAGVTRRGAFFAAGSVVASAGTRLTPALVPLLASQGSVSPICHRRVRVALLAVGRRWVAPTDAPTLDRERNAGNFALAALIDQMGALPHDYRAVAGRDVRPALDRATTAPVVVVLGALRGSLARHWDALGYEPTVDRLPIAGIGVIAAGVLREVDGRVANHVIHLPSPPTAALAGFALVVAPLIARLQGLDRGPTDLPLADGADLPATGPHARVLPAVTRTTPDGRLVAEPVARPLGDLAAWSRTDGLVVLPAESGPWPAGARVEFLPHGLGG